MSAVSSGACSSRRGPEQKEGSGGRVEGIGSFGAGLARHLLSEGVLVLKVNRPNRQHRRRAFGKSDPTDAEAAARAVLAGTAKGLSKGANGKVEMIRTLRVARRSAMKAR